MFTINDFFTIGLIRKFLSDSTPAIVISALVLMVAAYLLGSINFAIIISGKKYHEDIRSHGSKNAGMTNMMRTYGRSAAAFTLIGDAAKAIVSCLIGYALLGLLGSFIGGFFCILGHVFPVFYRFKGGKGVVTAFATVLMCDPVVFLVLLVFFVLIVYFTKYISLGSIMCMLLYPILHDRFYALLGQAPSPLIPFTVMIALVIVIKHWQNIKRLLSGKESKFSFKKSVKAPEDTTAKEDEQ